MSNRLLHQSESAELCFAPGFAAFAAGDAHPAVAILVELARAFACVGVVDAKTGEAVKLVIVKKDPNLSEEDVRAFCKENLTGYKQPKVVEFRTDLPKTPVGKILRRELRDK